eukprot:scaffold15002_cov131-Isochrysis_galbana.AAC.8
MARATPLEKGEESSTTDAGMKTAAVDRATRAAKDAALAHPEPGVSVSGVAASTLTGNTCPASARPPDASAGSKLARQPCCPALQSSARSASHVSDPRDSASACRAPRRVGDVVVTASSNRPMPRGSRCAA